MEAAREWVEEGWTKWKWQGKGSSDVDVRIGSCEKGLLSPIRLKYIFGYPPVVNSIATNRKESSMLVIRIFFDTTYSS